MTGPHSLREIQTFLKLGKIHSLYRIQVEGEWILLRDRLADLEHDVRQAEGRKAERLATPEVRSFDLGSNHPGSVPDAMHIPDNEPLSFENTLGRSHQSQINNGPEVVEPKGLAITSFALSLFFFVPFLNGITWLMSLIFGHLALSQSDARNRSKLGTFAWVGLWISYVEICFLMLAFAWLVLMDFPNMTLGYLMLHGQMLSSVIGALIGAGVLMLAVKLTSGSLVGFSECFVGALVPSALNFLGIMCVQTSIPPVEMFQAKGIVLTGVVYAILFVTQMFFWASFIRLPEDDSELGLARGALASLLYTFIFIFVGIGYAILFAALV